MQIIIVDSKGGRKLWRDEWPVVPRTGETVHVKGNELEVLDVDHDFRAREIRVMVRVPLGVNL